MVAEVVWTFEDEAQLGMLTERKEQFESQRRRALERLLEDVFYSGIGFDEIVNDMINKAERYAVALAPFIGQKTDG